MQLLKLSALCFLLVASFSLTRLPAKPLEVNKIYADRERVTGSALPVLVGNSTFPVISAQGTIAVDLDSSVIMYEKNADYPLLPASTTKILTALVVLDSYPLEEVIMVPRINVEGQKMHLVTGEKITVENLLYGLLVFSANDAAEVFAASFPEGRQAFVDAMNAKALSLGMKHSYFVNPTGLDNSEHVSTARDMMRLAEVALENEVFAKIVSTKSITVKSVDERFIHPLSTTNQLLGKVEGVMGVKTGWTLEARENLVTYIVRGEKKVLIALLGSQDRFGESLELINWIFKNYSWQEINY